VLIQRNANHEFDVTDEVHPDTAEVAALAARIVGLDIAGVTSSAKTFPSRSPISVAPSLKSTPARAS